MTRCVNWLRHLAAAAVLLALAAQTAPLWAQAGTGRLSGVVRDQATGQPLAGATIRLEGTSRVAISEANGTYIMVGVTPGTYTVVTEILGYATHQRENVQINSDTRTELNFDMVTRALAVQEVIVEAERVPLIELQGTGSRDVITSQEIDALPVSNVGEMLALQHGFFEIPLDNPDLISFMDQERGITGQSIRGGRMGENITLVDGIPVTNFIAGDSPLNLSTIAVEQMDYARGGFDAAYGNALSGVVNIRTREPREYYQGSLQLNTSAVGGLLGSKYDELRADHELSGYISGPIPGTNNKLMFVVTANTNEASGRPYQYDDHVFVPWLPQNASSLDQRSNQELSGANMDLIPGWRSEGYSRSRDVMAKIQYRYSPVARLTFQVTDSESKTGSRGFTANRIGFDVVGQCLALYSFLEDVCRRHFAGGIIPETIDDLRQLDAANQWVELNSQARTSRLYAANWTHTIPSKRLSYTIAAGRTESFRDSCTVAAGYCYGERLGWLSTQTGSAFYIHGGSRVLQHAIYGTSNNTSGDRSISDYFSGDLQWQATDNHSLSMGFQFQRHEIFNTETRQIGNNNILLYETFYSGNPWDGALHISDRIEYDFLTLTLGLRFDYGVASGLFFANPQDPTNGTTAFHVCENPTGFGLPANTFSHTYFEPEVGQEITVTGITACALNQDLLAQARDKAMEDDFREAKPRRALSPRMGISFPVTENSSVFFNYGRFTQNPRYNNLYRLTAIGTEWEGTRDALGFVQGAARSPLIGNAHLLQEQTTNYELGYNAAFGDGKYGFNATMYMKDQYNLTGSRQGGVDEYGRVIFDPGSTYRSTTMNYQVLMNLDFQTARGVELTLRRRLENYWAFDLRYSYSQVRTNAAPPELEIQRRQEGEQAVRREIPSLINRPHTGSMALRFQIDRNTPDIPFGHLLRNTQLSFTGRYSTGIPYTPQLSAAGEASARLNRNSAQGPPTYTLDMQARKSFRHANMTWAAFLRATNVLNLKTCARVYPSTGRCDGGQLQRARLVDSGVGLGQQATVATGSAGIYSQQWDQPQYYNPPRAISAGLQVTF